MFKITVEVKEKIVTDATHNKIMRQMMFEAAVKYKERTFPKLFEDIPATRTGGTYGYKARRKKYQRRKEKEKGHRKPFVFDGRFARDLIASTRIKATPNKWTLRGRFSGRGLKGSQQAQFKRELSAVSPAEIQDIIRWMRKRYVELANRPENQRQRTHR